MSFLSNTTLIILHVLFGILAAYNPWAAAVLVPGFLLYSVLYIFSTKNANHYAATSAAYITGLEVLTRMTGANLPYESGKYAVCIILLSGILVEVGKRKNTPLFPIIYFLCLLPSIIVTSYPDVESFRQNVSFNLSGPLSLAFSAYYFYKKVFSRAELKRIFLALLLPIVSTLAVVIVRMPTIQSINFEKAANFSTAGGFGSNQVSTIFGLGFLLVGLAWFLRIVITRNVLMDRAIGIVSLGYGILTFSRGGVLVPAFILFLCTIIMALKSKNPQQFIRTIWIISIVSVIAGGAFLVVNNLTNNALVERYSQATDEKGAGSGYNENVRVQGVNLSGRESIFVTDILIFAMNPVLGVGPGMAFEARGSVGGLSIAAHTEQSRLLSEHGLFGVVALLILVLQPRKAFLRAPNLDTKIVSMAFTMFGFFTMLHSAMRTAAPGFMYGLGFIILIPTLRNPLMRTDDSNPR